jgi:hypothetical protein
MTAKPQKHTDYSGTPLPKKLGIVSVSAKASVEVALLGAPEGFRESLGELPASVTFAKRITAGTTLGLCFVRSVKDLAATIDILGAQLPPAASAWIIHPKATHKPGFNQNDVRDAALLRGLVDYKVCSVDEDWSGLKFAWRKVTS